jgi:hypothetical protein
VPNRVLGVDACNNGWIGVTDDLRGYFWRHHQRRAVYRLAMAVKYPRRRLADWTPDLGELDDWLAEQVAEGWRREYEGPGVGFVINGEDRPPVRDDPGRAAGR